MQLQEILKLTQKCSSVSFPYVLEYDMEKESLSHLTFDLPECRPESKPLDTGIKRLNSFLDGFPLNYGVIEFGCPHGSFGRVIPALIARSLGNSCLWAYDDCDLNVYPNSWADIGFDLSRVSFIRDMKPIKCLKPVFNKKVHDVIVLDSKEFIRPSDLRYLANTARRQNVFFILLRNFYLSNKNGNPFCKYRINSSFDLSKKSFKLILIKGSNKKFLSLSMQEVYNG